MSSRYTVRKVLGNVVLPLVGFGVGWMAFNVMEEKGILSESLQRRITINNLKMQRLVQKALPASVIEKYGYPEEALSVMIDQMEKGYTEEEISERMTFEQVLGQCGQQEQIAFLEDHATEAIPYFYIADIFHSWATMQRDKYVKNPSEDDTDSTLSGAAGAVSPILRNDPDFDSEILCYCLWDKTTSGIMPFDVAIRALCVLAVTNHHNAKRLANLVAPDTVVELFRDYKDRLQKSEDPKGDVVDAAEVTAATLFFLRAVNDASVHRRWIPLVGRPSTGPYPLASGVTASTWCDAFTPEVVRSVSEIAADGAVVLADIMDEKMRCAEWRQTAATVS